MNGEVTYVTPFLNMAPLRQGQQAPPTLSNHLDSMWAEKRQKTRVQREKSTRKESNVLPAR